ncbi:MAG TPA: hypothetical protein VG796_07670 [Verrucomicrobiales bacterium]|nr:hypothetical protein [Verrucomicrobiales bacterium]
MNAKILLFPLLLLSVARAAEPTAQNSFQVTLPPPPFAEALLTDSPFGINTAFHPDTQDLDARLTSMQQAGIKWGRQDFTWRRIEKVKGAYEWEGYDRLVGQCRQKGVLLFGNLTYNPAFYDMKSAEGVEGYCAFARAAVKRYAGKVDHWQIWNEPNLGYLGGSPEEYARLLSASGKAIHEANPKAKVLGLNMAFCDALWAERILKLVPNDCFDIACFHPYRNPNAPEDKFDWWVLDQYVKRFHKELTPEFPMVHQSFLEQTDELIKTMSRFGSPKPLWVTEMCFNTHIHPYGVSELREADLAVRFYLLAIASRKIEKVFWWTLKDGGQQQFDAAEMVGLARADLTPKYAWYAHAFMTRMLEGKKWVRNDSFGPDIYAAVFTDETKGEDTMALWSPKPFAYVRINNTEKGLTFFDIYGTKRFVPYNKVRTGHLPVPLGESPIYVVGPKGLKATVRPDPGW